MISIIFNTWIVNISRYICSIIQRSCFFRKGMELLIGFPGIGCYNMIATEDVDDDLWIFVLLEFVDDGLYDAVFQNGIRWLRLWFL